MTTLISLRGDDDRFYFQRPDIGKHLPWNSSSARITADGQEVTPPAQGWDRYATGWIALDVDPTEFTLHWRSADKTVGWQLDDPAYASERTPVYLSVEAFHDLPDQVRDSGIYRAVKEPGEDRSVTFTADQWVRYDGTPAPEDGHTWVAKLEHSLTHHREIHHLYPGHMPGFQETAKAYLKDRREIQYVFEKGQHLEVHFRIPYDVPKTEWRSKVLRSGRESRKREQVTLYYSKTVMVPAPLQIAAVSRAAAATEWDRRMAELAAFVAETTTLRACSHCNGAGVITGGAK